MASFFGEAEFPISTLAVSSVVWMNNVTINSAKLVATETKQDTDQIIFYLSADGGSNYEEVTNGTPYYFANTGVALKWQVRFVGYSGNATYFSDLKIYINV